MSCNSAICGDSQNNDISGLSNSVSGFILELSSIEECKSCFHCCDGFCNIYEGTYILDKTIAGGGFSCYNPSSYICTSNFAGGTSFTDGDPWYIDGYYGIAIYPHISFLLSAVGFKLDLSVYFVNPRLNTKNCDEIQQANYNTLRGFYPGQYEDGFFTYKYMDYCKIEIGDSFTLNKKIMQATTTQQNGIDNIAALQFGCQFPNSLTITAF